MGEEPVIKTVKQLAYPAFLLLVLICVPAIVRTEQRFRKCVNWYLLSAVVVSLWGIYQVMAASFDLPYTYALNNNMSFRPPTTQVLYGIPRANSVLPEPSFFANYLLSVVPLCWVLTFNRRNYPATKYALVLCLASAALLASTSRAGILVCAAVIFFFVISSRYHVFQGKNIAYAGLLLLVLLVGLLFVFGSWSSFVEFVERNYVSIFSLSDVSATGRLAALQIGWEIFLEYPVVGVGLGNFSVYVPTYYGYYQTYNLLTNLMAETGFVGLVGFSAVIIALYYQYRRLQKKFKRGSMLFNSLTGVYLSLVGVILNLLVALPSLGLMHMWFLMALLVCLGNLASQDRKLQQT